MDTNKAVQFSCSFVSNSLRPHGLQHLRPPYPSPTPGTCSILCPSSWWCHPTFSSSVIPFSSCLLSSVFPRITVFSKESVLCIRWPKYWSFSFSISSSNEYSGLISFRVDWLDLFAVQGTLKSLLQHDSSKTSFLWHSAFFIVLLSHLYMTTGKIIALTRHTFVGQVMSLLFNMAVPRAYFTILSSERFGKGHVIQIRVTPRPSTGHMEKECFLLWLLSRWYVHLILPGSNNRKLAEHEADLEERKAKSRYGQTSVIILHPGLAQDQQP